MLEDLAVKQEVLAAASAAAPERCWPPTPRSSRSTAVTERGYRPERVLGTHWWNPPDLIPVVEVIPRPETAPASRPG